MEEQTMPKQDVAPESSLENSLTVYEEIVQIKDDLAYLRDLFVRRLNDDKQKNAAFQKLLEAASFSFIEPFLHDIVLLLDRLEKSEDGFAKSVAEELYDIINRRGVELITETNTFNPAVHKAVKVVNDSEATEDYIAGIIRKGYSFSGRVLRPMEVVIGRAEANNREEQEGLQ